MTDVASGRMVAIDNLRRNMRRNRQRVGNTLPLPGTAAENVIPRPTKLQTEVALS